MKYENLFEPIKVRGLELKNRIVFPAMGTRMADADGFVNQKLIDYHVARAKGGNGLNILEVACVHEPSSPEHFVSIADDRYIPKLKEFVDEVHKVGGKVGLQLWQGAIAVMGDDDAEVFVPSDTPLISGETAKGATVDKIEEVVKSYGKAAARAVKAGFDTIEIHAGHNYSPHMFLSSAFNKRTDEYGGSLENRARYLMEIIGVVRANVPEDMPIFMRIVAHDDYLENGLSAEDMIKVSKMAGEKGVDVLNISRGNIVTNGIKYEVPPIDIDPGFNVHNAERFKKETGMLVQAVGRINDPKQADEILEEGKADFITIGRGQIADPEFANKAREGRSQDIVKCIACNQGCYDGFVNDSLPHITCMRNPAVGLEEKYEIKETNSPKRIAIVGGGIAGLEVAIKSKERGNIPVIFEKTHQLGGQLLLAGVAPKQDEIAEAARSRGGQVLRAGIEVRINTEFTRDIMERENFDIVVLATGSEPVMLNMPGVDLGNTFLSHEILKGEKKADGKIAIIGGGLVGLELAEIFGENEDNEVTVMEMLDTMAGDLGQLRRIAVMERLEELGVELKTSVACKEITKDSLIYEEDGETKELDIDYVVLAVGSRSNDTSGIEEYCEDNNIPIHKVGDAVEARTAVEAIKEAVDVALFEIS